MNYKTIDFEIVDKVATIKLNRPEYYNSLNEQMAKELLNVAYECDQNSSISV